MLRLSVSLPGPRASSINRSRDRGLWGCCTKAASRLNSPLVITLVVPFCTRVRAARSSWFSPKLTWAPSATGVPDGMLLRRRSTASIRAVSSRGRNGLPR